MQKSQAKIDEFGFVLLAGIIFIIILLLAFGTPPAPEAPPQVEPTFFSTSIPNGTSKSFDLRIVGNLTNVTLSAKGEIATWINFDKNYFDVVENETVKVTINVPSKIAFRNYTGKIEVTSKGGKASVSLSINVVNVTVVLASRAINLGDFFISYTDTSKVFASKENFEISRGYFSRREANLIASIEERQLQILTGAKILVFVEETNSYGNLIVLLNEKVVFNKKVGPGILEIPIDASLVNKSNTIVIKTGLPGIRFWASTVYKIKNASFIAEFKGIYTKEIPFSLSKDEIANFQHFRLTFRSNYTTIPPELIITINDQIVYMGRSTYIWWDLNITEDLFKRKLYVYEQNKISFFFEREGYLEIKNALLEVFYKV